MPRLLSARLILYLLVLVVADLTLSPLVRVGDVQPVFLLLMVLYGSFQWGWQKALPLALIVGFLRDMTGTLPVGTEMFSVTAAALFLDFAVQKLHRVWILVRIGTAFVFTFIALMVALILGGVLHQPASFSWYNAGRIFLTAVYTAAFWPLFSAVSIRWFHERKPMKQYELFG